MSIINHQPGIRFLALAHSNGRREVEALSAIHAAYPFHLERELVASSLTDYLVETFAEVSSSTSDFAAFVTRRGRFFWGSTASSVAATLLLIFLSDCTSLAFCLDVILTWNLPFCPWAGFRRWNWLPVAPSPLLFPYILSS